MTEETDKNAESKLSLKDFKFDRILFNNAAKRLIGLLGSYPNLSETDQGIVIITKDEFAEESFTSEQDSKSFLKNTDLELNVINDIYANFIGTVAADLNKLKVSIIYPATQKHIDKYIEQKLFLIEETPELYQNVILRFLLRDQFSLEWVYNILEHKQEQDKIVFEDLDPHDGFILVPDYKWNGQIESMYLLAISMDRGIKSIRDLNEKHLPLLEKIKAESLKAIKDKYGLDAKQVRAYFHYQPTFYHLHVHFTYLQYDAPGIFCEKSHLLNTVINNIKLKPDYYQQATLTFAAREKDKLYQAIQEAEAKSKEQAIQEAETKDKD